MTDKLPAITTYTDEWLARIDQKLGLLIDAVKPATITVTEPAVPAVNVNAPVVVAEPAAPPAPDDLITEPAAPKSGAARQRTRTRQGNQIQ